MMNKKRTKELGRTKYLMFFPLAALLMIVSNIESVARATGRLAAEVIEVATDVPTPSTIEATNAQPDQPSAFQTAIQEPTESQDPIYEVVEQMPEFPEGGMVGLMKYLSDNICYPEAARQKGVQGRVTVQFVVETDGSIDNLRVLSSRDPDLDAEAIRVAATMPKWKPGMHQGKVVRVKYTIPVLFRLSGGEASQQQAVPEAIPVESDGKQDDTVFEVVEQMPKVPDGGMPGLINFFSANIQYPEEAIKAKMQGRVTVQFVVDKEGNVTNPKILRGVCPSLDAEALRLLSIMPKWHPGMHRGEAVDVKYTVPIVFTIPQTDTQE